jgi:hypothetical protein
MASYWHAIAYVFHRSTKNVIPAYARWASNLGTLLHIVRTQRRAVDGFKTRPLDPILQQLSVIRADTYAKIKVSVRGQGPLTNLQGFIAL